MVGQSGLKHFRTTVDQNIDNRGTYNLSFCCILKLLNQLKNIVVPRAPAYFITAKHRQILSDSFVIMMTNSKVPLDKHTVLNRPVKHASKTQPAIASSISVKS